MKFIVLLLGFTWIATSELQAQTNKLDYKTWEGTASFYHNKFHGKRTASGEIFNQNALTCANNFLPLGTILRVTNLSNNKTVVVKVNDRLAKSNKRLVDLSYKAAQELSFIKKGITKVRIEVLPENEIEPDQQEIMIEDSSIIEVIYDTLRNMN